MNTLLRRSLAAVALAALLASTAPLAAHARAPHPARRQEEGKDKKKSSEKDATKEDKARQPTKQEREYQKIKQFSLKRYAENPSFREEVEAAYQQKKREHSEYAFDINTRNGRDEQVTRDGDRLKINDTLYDNPLAQDYVNRLGQSLVPANTRRLYAFKIRLNPVPEARSLSTGTVYVSTGLLAQIDNEAQLAYVLGHEIAHVEKDHWKEDVLVQHGLEAYNEKQQQKRSLIGGIANIGSRVVSGGFISAGNLMGATVSMYAEMAVPTLVKMAAPDAVVSWDKQQEDEADQHGLQYMLARSYDPREVPKFYRALQRMSQRDERTGLGFMANAARVAERVDYLTTGVPLGGGMQTTLLVGAVNLNMRRQTEAIMDAAKPAPEHQPDTGKAMDPSRDSANRANTADRQISAMSAEIEEKLRNGDLIGSSGEFLAVMAELKRDNGIRAFYYDMFQVARDNLQESLDIRSNDPLAHFYYGKVLKLTARSPSEKSKALAEFARAIELDKRRVLPEAYLHRALAVISNNNGGQAREAINDLKEYVTLYQREHAGQLPPNMDVIYDYMQDAGELNWAATPAMNVSTRNIDPLGVAMGAAKPAAVTPPPAAQTQPAPTAPAPKPATRAGKRQ